MRERKTDRDRMAERKRDRARKRARERGRKKEKVRPPPSSDLHLRLSPVFLFLLRPLFVKAN